MNAAAEQHRPGGRGVELWLVWTLASALGPALGGAVGAAMGTPAGLLPLGLFAGIPQAGVLHAYTSARALRWLVTAGIGWPLSVISGYGVALLWIMLLGLTISPPQPAPHSTPPDNRQLTGLGGLLIVLLLVGPGGAFGSALFGLFQWPALRRPIAILPMWLACHLLAGIVPGLLFFGLMNSLSNGDTQTASRWATIGGASYGAITGIALARMFGRRDAEVSPPTR